MGILDPKPVTPTSLDSHPRLSATALNATYGPPTSALQDIIGRLRTGVQDVSILVLSDSTAAMAGSWVKQLPAALVAQFPGYKVSLKEWVDGSPGSWGAATVTGTGTRTINLWNGSVAGQSWEYHMDATRRESLISTPAPDVVMYSLGHNDNYSLAQVNNLRAIRDKASTYIEVMRTIAPTAAVILMSQNPLLGTDRNLASQFRADLYRRMALERGYGFIDICQAFIDDPQPLTTLVSGDLVHPAAAGFTVWANEVMRHFRSQSNSQVIPMQLPSFHTASKNYVRNPAFESFAPPAAPQDWILTNATVTKDTVRYETGGWSVQMAKAGAGLSSLAISIFPTSQLAGQWLTFAARVYIPAGNPASSAQVAIHSNTVNATSDQWGVFDQWFWRTVTVRIPVGENSVSVEVINDQTGATAGISLVDRVTCIIGRYPVDLF